MHGNNRPNPLYFWNTSHGTSWGTLSNAFSCKPATHRNHRMCPVLWGLVSSLRWRSCQSSDRLLCPTTPPGTWSSWLEGKKLKLGDKYWLAIVGLTLIVIMGFWNQLPGQDALGKRQWGGVILPAASSWHSNISIFQGGWEGGAFDLGKRLWLLLAPMRVIPFQVLSLIGVSEWDAGGWEIWRLHSGWMSRSNQQYHRQGKRVKTREAEVKDLQEGHTGNVSVKTSLKDHT